MKKDLLADNELSLKDIEEIFSLTQEVKRSPVKFQDSLKGKSVALIFQKPSNRTRVSFEVGVWQLGGHTTYLKPEDINLGVRESIKDVAKTLSRYLDAIVVRTFSQKIVEDLARNADIPVINGLSDLLHPCQALTDIFTIREKLGELKGVTLTYVGDGNNVCNSLSYVAAKAGMNFRVATPKKFAMAKEIVNESLAIAKTTGASVSLFSDAKEGVKASDVIYTDVWTSMGKEKEALNRRKTFKSFQINRGLVALAKPGVLVMHCLPAHRGEEITDEVIDGPNSVVFDQAENRLHVQKAIMIKLMNR